MQAADLCEEKIKPSEVAGRLRVSVKSVYHRHQLWRDGGGEALVSRGPSGSRCRLSPNYLEQGPAAHGWVEDQVWTASRVTTLIGRRFHVSYSVSGATWLMHRLGFSPQVPARRAAERDEQAVTAFKEVTWAEVKRPGRPAGDTSASKTKQDSPGARPQDGPGPTRPHPRRDDQRPALGTAVGGRTHRDAARIADPAVPPPAHPLRRQGARRSMGEQDFIELIDGAHPT
ncbi:winged helix-turn-helix domain-containing protein [Streptomyces sp900105245]|uniref:Winged helix-turn-helix domain-containing protein n=1 Tax=Streptomyces sp. 900105245 TaxID=3154379 RepID=A0ABV1UKR2_9ACTN